MKVGASLKGEAKLLTFRIALWASSYNIQSYRKEVLRPVFARVKVDGEGLEVLLHAEDTVHPWTYPRRCAPARRGYRPSLDIKKPG
jgi:hypothetical protein